MRTSILIISIFTLVTNLFCQNNNKLEVKVEKFKKGESFDSSSIFQVSILNNGKRNVYYSSNEYENNTFNGPNSFFTLSIYLDSMDKSHYGLFEKNYGYPIPIIKGISKIEFPIFKLKKNQHKVFYIRLFKDIVIPKGKYYFVLQFRPPTIVMVLKKAYYEAYSSKFKFEIK